MSTFALLVICWPLWLKCPQRISQNWTYTGQRRGRVGGGAVRRGRVFGRNGSVSAPPIMAPLCAQFMVLSEDTKRDGEEPLPFTAKLEIVRTHMWCARGGGVSRNRSYCHKNTPDGFPPFGQECNRRLSVLGSLVCHPHRGGGGVEQGVGYEGFPSLRQQHPTLMLPLWPEWKVNAWMKPFTPEF